MKLALQASAWTVAVHYKVGEPPHRVVQPE
jgi:hypothetical protein